MKFYAWIDIIECTNIEALRFDGSYFKSNLFRRYRKTDMQQLSFLLPVTHL